MKCSSVSEIKSNTPKKEKAISFSIPDPYLVNYAATDRAKCKSCHATLYKGSVRFGRKIRSPWHDGFDIEYRHFVCGMHYVKHPQELSGLMDLRWEDIQYCVKKLLNKPLDENNEIIQEYRRRNISLWNLKEKLMTFPLSCLKHLLKINGMQVDAQAKIQDLAHSVADDCFIHVWRCAMSILFGRLPKCPLCDHFCLRQSGPSLRCMGYLEGSNTRCHFFFLLHNIYNFATPAHHVLHGMDAKDFQRKESFFVTPLLYDSPVFSEWKSLMKVKSPSHSLESNPEFLEAKKTIPELSESESESSVVHGKELLGFTFTCLGLSTESRKHVESLARNHGGTFRHKVEPGVTFLLVGKHWDSLKHTRQFNEALHLNIPILDSHYLTALLSSRSSHPEGLSKKPRMEKEEESNPCGLKLRRRHYMKFYLKAGQVPSTPYPTVKSLLNSCQAKNVSVIDESPQSSHSWNAPLMTIDPWFDKKPGHRLYVDEHHDVYHLTTLFTDILTGINKFYNQQLIELSREHESSFWIFRRWGRVGAENKSTNDFLCDPYGKNLIQAKRDFEKRALNLTGIPWSEKSSASPLPGRYRYIFLESRASVVTPPSSTKPCGLTPPLCSLVEWIFDQKLIDATLEKHNIDTSKMPLGRISQEQILQGYAVLKKLEDLLNGPSHKSLDPDIAPPSKMDSEKYKTKILALTTQFYSTIPHSFSLKGTLPLLDSLVKVHSKTLLLENLRDMTVAGSIIKEAESSCHPLEAYYKALDCELTPLPKDSNAYQVIASNISKTHGITHSRFTLHVVDIFSYHAKCKQQRFNDFLQRHGNLNRYFVWHGSRVTNFASILKLGLQVTSQDAPTSGYMFGKGIYFTDIVTKAAQYCYATPETPYGLLILSEVALGSGLRRYQADPNAQHACDLNGHFHTWGIGQIPSCADTLTLPSLLDHQPLSFSPSLDHQETLLNIPMEPPKTSSLLYPEYIVYDTDQVLIRFIVKVLFKYKTLNDDLSSLSSSSSSSSSVEESDTEKEKEDSLFDKTSKTSSRL